MPKNRILARLSRADYALIEPHLEVVDLPVRKVLQPRNKRVEQVYFPESGIASVVANGETSLEIGMIGREGMTGVSVVLGADERAPHETYVQVAGLGQRLSAVHLLKTISCITRTHSWRKARKRRLQTADTRLRSVWLAGFSWPMIASTGMSSH